MDSSESNASETLQYCPEDAIYTFANEYYTPLLCLFGAVGNCLSIYVFFTTVSHRSLTSSYYLSALAASDTGFLINVFVFWMATVHGIDMITTSVSCPIFMYSGQVISFLSVWFVVAFTVERFFAVCYPLTRPTVCTVTRARRVITGLSLVAVSVFSYVLFIAEVIEDTSHFPLANSSECFNVDFVGDVRSQESNESTIGQVAAVIDPNYSLEEKLHNESRTRDIPDCSFEPYFICSVRTEYHKVSQIANYVDTFFTFVLPFCVISFLNFRITLCVWKLKGQRETIVALSKLNRSGGGGPTTMGSTQKSRVVVVNVVNDDGGAMLPNNSQHRNGTQRRAQHRGPGLSSVSRKSRSSRATTSTAHSTGRAATTTSGEVRVTKTLLLVSTVFLVFNLPAHAIRGLIFIKSTLLHHPIGCDWVTAQQWSNMLFNTNFGVNFLLYCVSGRNFRKSLRNIFCPKNEMGMRGKRRFLTAKPFLRCPYSSKKRTRDRDRDRGCEGRGGGGGNQLLGEPEPMSDLNNTRNPSIHSTTAFVSKTQESFFPTCLTEVEQYG